MMKKTTKVAVMAVAALMVLSGCEKPSQVGTERPRRSEAPEYDCRKHAPDKICEVPWKDKVVLYCYKSKIPKVVRSREEC